jgi:tRNA (guanine10-N2)-dimethyltransferase
MAEIIPKPFFYRTPRKKPFFHPSSLQPKLARCMVNLSRAREGHIVLDPFCGTGTILIEAGLMDIETVGIDLREDMVVGAKRNLTYYGVKNHNLIIANALKIPLKHVDRIVTDPPYGRCATTMGRTALEVFENCLNEAIDLLPPEGYICIASPKTLNIRDLGKAVGFKLVEKYSVYVHRSLTRDIAVLKRK